LVETNQNQDSNLGSRLQQDLKNDLIAGLLVVIPLATTIWLSSLVSKFVLTLVTSVPKQLNPFITLNPLIVNSAEILQIKSSNTILVGDQNRNLTIGLFCVDVNENDELEATNLLKSEFPRGSKVKIKPFGFKENVLLAKVFNIKGTKEMTELLVAKDLTSKICPS